MCLNNLKNLKPEIAKRSILCYKNSVGDYCTKSEYTSFVFSTYGFTYYRGKLTEKVVMKKVFDEIFQGYHSYKYNRKLKGGVFIIPRKTGYYEGQVNSDGKGYASEQLVYLGKFWSIRTWFNVLAYKLYLK